MEHFYSIGALVMNNARIEHLKYLNLPLNGKTIYETGCGARGDFTEFFIDNGASVTVNDNRIENIEYLLNNNSKIRNGIFSFNTNDLNKSIIDSEVSKNQYDIIFSYGTLYHLDRPDISIENFAKTTKDFLIMSTCVSLKSDYTVNNIREDFKTSNQSTTGTGCRPTRLWILAELKKHFKYVFISTKQPNHSDYKIDWHENSEGNSRCIFLATNDDKFANSLDANKWTTEIPMKQERIPHSETLKYFYNSCEPIYVTKKTLENTEYTFMLSGELWEIESVMNFYKRINPVKKLNIIDIGAQSGLYSLYAKYLPNATFYSFEPYKLTYDILLDNLALNDITNVKTFNLAISDKIGQCTLNVCTSNNGLNTLCSDLVRFNEENCERITIETETIDNMFYERNISVDFIKIDTEGHEYNIIKGSLKTLEKWKPLLQLEWSLLNMKQANVAEDDLRNLLYSIGYIETEIVSEDVIFEHIDNIPEYKTMEKMILESGLELNSDKKIILPDHVTSLRFDVGLSYGAPMTQIWMENQKKSGELFVFGFEPNKTSVQRIFDKNNKKSDPGHSDVLNSKYYDSIRIMPIALGSENKYVSFYVTGNDVGCSSVYEPTEFEIKEKVIVPMYKLSLFMNFIDFSRIQFIEYLKIDAQGSDLNIVKSLGTWISKFLYITLEAETSLYKNIEYNNVGDIHKYMHSREFLSFTNSYVSDPTFVNSKFLIFDSETGSAQLKDEVKDIFIIQIG